MLLLCGSVAGTHTVAVEDSDDGVSGWAAVDPGQIQGAVPTITTADDDTVLEFGIAVTRRFLRINLTTSDTLTSGTIGALVVLGELRFAIDRS